EEDLIAPSCGQRIALGLGVLIAGRDPPIADPHGPDRIANPRQVDVDEDTPSVTNRSCGNPPTAGLSHQRTLTRTAGSLIQRRLNIRLCQPRRPGAACRCSPPGCTSSLRGAPRSARNLRPPPRRRSSPGLGGHAALLRRARLPRRRVKTWLESG